MFFLFVCVFMGTGKINSRRRFSSDAKRPFSLIRDKISVLKQDNFVF